MYLSVTFHTADDYALYKAFVNNNVVVSVIFGVQNYLSVLLRIESLYRSTRSDDGKHHIAVLGGVLSADRSAGGCRNGVVLSQKTAARQSTEAIRQEN